MNNHAGRVVRRFVTAFCVLMLISTILAPVGSAAPSKGSNGLRIIGQLPNTSDQYYGRPVAIDQKRRLMYYMYRFDNGPLFFLREYDLRSEIPRLLREKEMGTYAELGINYFSANTVALDAKRRLLIILVTHTHGTALKFIDLKTMKFVGQWDLANLVPGFVGQGMTLSERDGRIYMVGSQAGNAQGTLSAGAQKPVMPALSMAIDLKLDPSDTPSILWTKPIPQCQQIMDTTQIGALVARSRNAPALYFACVRPNLYPGESGVVRLWIKPKADQQAAVDFPVDFFPVSGSFSNQTRGIMGVSAFDPIHERFFIQSMSQTTPGLWVLDGLRSAWVGFVASPDSFNYYFGLDPVAGHYYMGGGQSGAPGYLVTSDVGSTPTSQGLISSGIPVQNFITVDPPTRRLFVPVDLKPLGFYKGDAPTMNGIAIIRDETSIADPARPIDYDSITRNVPEGPGVVTSYSGGVNGYGTRLMLIGGYGGVTSATGLGDKLTLSQVRPGDRGLTAARVTTVDLRNAGAAAGAQALVPDANTEAEFNEAMPDDQGLDWPWVPTNCLSGGDEPESASSEEPGGSASVTCDLAKQTASASSSAGPVSADGLKVAGSSFQTSAVRDSKKGIVTETVAKTRGIEVSVPGGQTLSIASIWARSTSVAHGRSGSAKATYERRISGLELTDADGKVVQRVAACGAEEDVSCQDALDQINRQLSLRMRVYLPKPSVSGSPGGAFATIEQNDGDFYQGRTMDNQGSAFSREAASRAVPALQVTLFNDSDEKSRLVAQFAAIQANSIYTNTPYHEQPVINDPKVEIDPPSTGGASGGSGISTPDIGLGGGDISPTASTVSEPIQTAVASNPVEGVLAFLRHSPGEALLLAGIWSLFISAFGGLMRRRSLLAVLNGGN